MSSNNKESLNDMVNRLTLENEQLKRTSINHYIDNMERLEREVSANGEDETLALVSFARKTAQQFLKNRG